MAADQFITMRWVRIDDPLEDLPECNPDPNPHYRTSEYVLCYYENETNPYYQYRIGYLAIVVSDESICYEWRERGGETIGRPSHWSYMSDLEPSPGDI